MVDIDYQFEFIRFFIGSIGTIAYFMCVKYEFFIFDLDSPQKNSNAIQNNKVALVFFCFLGGLIPYLMDIRQPYGWFIQGFSLRLTLSAFWSSAAYNEISKGVRKND